MDASGVYVAGRAGYYLPGQPWFGSSDAFVRKYDFDGNEVWTRQFGTTATDEATSVSVDATGVYVVGNAQDAFPGHTHEGLIDVFVRKYDTDGTEGWTHQFGSVGSDWASGVSVGASGVYVAGGTSDALPGQIHEGGWDAFAHKCDLAGNPLWTRQFGTAEADEAPGISVDASGAYVAGATLGVLPGQTSSGSRDAFIRKYDATGAEVWTRQFGGTGNDRFFDVSVDASGVYLSGFTGGRLPGQSGGGTGDAFVRMYDFDGAGLWTQQFGTSAWDLSYAVSVGASGAYAAGETSGTLPGQTSSGGYDAFLVRFAPPPALQVAAGGAYSCGLRTDGAVVCWGVDSRGQASPPAETFTQVAAGALFTCGLKTDGSLACWGWDGEPQIDPPAGTFTQVTVGNAHACGLEADGSVVCWGADSYGGATPPAGTFTQIDAGSYHTCGVETGGSVVCWGYNVSGQASPPSGTFTQVAAGGHHSCAIQLGGSVVCWGSDTRGESTPPADTFTHISAGTGQGHTCGLKAGGSVICWGDDVFGQSTPYVDSFTQVSAGDNHSCGVRIEGSVICWGNDNYGQSTTPPPLQ
jgi:Tfp pilus assembly protein PilW